MYSKVVVPLDGSELSERSLPYARLIAGALSIPIELVEAFDVLPPAVHTASTRLATQRMHEAAQEQTEDHLGRVRAELRDQGYAATATTLHGQPAQAIMHWVGDDPDALVIMSTHGRGGIARWALGSVADKVLHVIPNPMLLIRDAAAKTAEEAEPKSVLAPLDGSALSELSLEHAAIMATALRGRIELLRVNPDAALYREYLGRSISGASENPDSGRSPAEEFAEADAGNARASLERAAHRLAGDFNFSGDVTCRTVESRNVADAIVNAATAERAMVVMTTHGRSGINRLMLGSVTDRVVRHSNVPVLVVRQSDTPSPAVVGQPAYPAGPRNFGGPTVQPA